MKYKYVNKLIYGDNSDYEEVKIGKNPVEKYQTEEGFTKWFDQKSWGSKKGSFGREKETTGKILNYEDFNKISNALKGK